MRRRWPFHDRAVPVVAWRVVIVLAGLLAEAWNIVNMVRDGEPPTEHFAYFTIQANILVIVLYLWMLAKPDEVWSWTIEYTNAAQHRFVPWMVGLDWLLVPTYRRIRLGRAGWWMAYPVAYLAAAWLRGALVDGWFPYPFLDPGEHGGWAGLLWPTGQVLLAFLVGIVVVASVGRLRYRASGGPASRDSSPSSTSSRPYENSSP